MSFEGRSRQQAGQALRDHLTTLLAHTLTHKPLIATFAGPTPTVFLSFRDGGQPSRAELHTRFGPMDLFVGQLYDAVAVDRSTYQLRPIEYQYTLTPVGSSEPLLRWEFVSTQPTHARWCQHHLQGPIPLRLGDAASVQLNDLHLPTGWVLLEEVVRFCIVDLGVQPLSADWDSRLRASARSTRSHLASLSEW
jgi:hypothetical protein